jgi:DNA-binding PadR family transcriptional regulator
LSSGKAQLTTTSFAILGLLAIRPWTPYELAQQMDRSLGRLWPRAQSKIYEEPKKLAAAGLARAEHDAVGRRPRTRYTITDEGRRALREWLETPSSPPALESEHLLKVFFAEHGSKEALSRTIASMRAWAEEQRQVHVDVARTYAAGEGRFPERAAVLSLTGRFVFEFNEMVAAWAEWAEGIIARWPDDPAEAQPDWRLYEEVARLEGDAPPWRGAISGVSQRLRARRTVR